MGVDYTRGDSPAYDGYREAWASQREAELQDRIEELESELSGYRDAEEQGRILPEGFGYVLLSDGTHVVFKPPMASFRLEPMGYFGPSTQAALEAQGATP